MMTVLAGLVLGCAPDARKSAGVSSDTVAGEPPVRAEVGGGDFAVELSRLDHEIAATAARAEAQPENWVIWEQLAGLQRQRARLSGDYDDYAAAEDAIEAAFSVAVEGSGPHLGRAGLNYTLHRFPSVAVDLDMAEGGVLVSDDTRGAVTLGRANLSWQQGDYTDAVALMEDALSLDETPAAFGAAAYFAWRQLDFEAAEALYDTSASMYHGTAAEPRAWGHLQLGLMDLERGRYAEALAHYRDADAELSGYWLIHEHIAEILVLQGDLATAAVMYRDVIDATGGPEFMDALAELRLAQGDEAAAADWAAQAAEVYAADLARYPEASAGHALGHYLTFGPADQAVSLAEANLALRDNSESRMWRAQARLAAGDLAGASSDITVALAGPWRTAELHATAAEVYAATGDTSAAGAQREAALAIDPFAVD